MQNTSWRQMGAIMQCTFTLGLSMCADGMHQLARKSMHGKEEHTNEQINESLTD